LPKSHIKTAASVLVYGVSITSTLVADDALTLSLVPFGESRAPAADVLAVGAVSTRTRSTIVTWAIATTRGAWLCRVIEIALGDHFRSGESDAEHKHNTHLK